MLAPVMPMPDAHGANLLPSRLPAELWLKQNLFLPLSSHATRLTSSINHSVKVFLKTNAIPLNAHGALQLQSSQHVEIQTWLSHSQPLYSHAITYQKRKNQASGDSSLECSNTDIEVAKTIEVVDTTEVVKINQKDAMEDMVEDITNNREVRMSKKVQETIINQELNQNQMNYLKVTWL